MNMYLQSCIYQLSDHGTKLFLVLNILTGYNQYQLNVS
jgi:hypothetical protein